MNLPTLIKAWSLTFQISTPWVRWHVGVYLRMRFGFGRGPDHIALWIGPLAIAAYQPYEYEDDYPFAQK